MSGAEPPTFPFGASPLETERFLKKPAPIGAGFFFPNGLRLRRLRLFDIAVADQEDRDAGLTLHKILGNAAEHQASQAGSAVRRHDDERGIHEIDLFLDRLAD